MNQKRAYKATTEPRPQYLHAVDIDVESKGRIAGHRIVAGQNLGVSKGVSRPAGQYVFRYAEWNHTLGEYLLYVERYGMRKCVRAADITRVIGSRG